MIVEFNGIPGSGKTTSLEILRHRLLKNNYNVYCNQQIMAEMKSSITPNLRVPVPDGSHRKTRRLQVLVSLVECAQYSRKYYQLIKCLYLGIRLRSKLHFLARTIEVLTIYDFFQRNYTDDEILLVDHGIIQNIISFCYMRNLPSQSVLWENSLPHLLPSEHTIVLVNCHASVATAFGRIRRRASQYGRIARLSDELMERTLFLQSCNFEKIRAIVLGLSISQIVDIDNDTESEYLLAEKLFSVLCSYNTVVGQNHEK